MRIRISAFVLLACCVVIAPQAMAQLLTDQMAAMPSSGTMQLNAARQVGAKAAQIPERLKIMGYTNIEQSASDPKQYYATTPQGMQVLLVMDPTTGHIITATPR